MKTLKEKSYEVEIVVPENEQEDRDIKKLISEIEREDKNFDMEKSLKKIEQFVKYRNGEPV